MYRVAREDGHERDFLTVGSMGHASSIALGIAIQKHNRQVGWSPIQTLRINNTPHMQNKI
ncbi:hypothetical protein DPMN_103670 [Dreissena polymorpha]|uniref:Uncharacterized protein n=1 Tax=Dreissena polymorpha TaxID=45954 RepID=A0A9D4HBH6_DREPO|nr:hypothetical protein DPMN_103670 [Dreissena polymorpha]